jgi:hypothetical protein
LAGAAVSRGGPETAGAGTPGMGGTVYDATGRGRPRSRRLLAILIVIAIALIAAAIAIPLLAAPRHTPAPPAATQPAGR